MPLSQTLYKHAQFAQPGLQVVAGNFTFAASPNPPDAAEGKPFAVDGTDLARTDTGDFTLTIPGRGAVDVLAAHFDLESSLGTALQVKMVARSDSARTISLTVVDGATQGTPTDPPDGAKLHVILFLKGRDI